MKTEGEMRQPCYWRAGTNKKIKTHLRPVNGHLTQLYNVPQRGLFKTGVSEVVQLTSANESLLKQHEWGVCVCVHFSVHLFFMCACVCVPPHSPSPPHMCEYISQAMRPWTGE